ncbi:hypothetical protein [Corynebacterium macginleyi]|nr:hypothetical protein [Corynebacterium macginleyi]
MRLAQERRPSFVNTLTAFFASDPGWADKFAGADLLVVSDSNKS